MTDNFSRITRRVPVRPHARPHTLARTAAALLVVLSPFSGVALAADEPRAGRFTMTPADGGFVRLDTETGGLALCAKKGDQWTCDPMPDTQQSQAREVERLQAENKALKGEIRRMEEVLGLGEPRPGQPPGSVPPGTAPPVAGGERPKGGLELPSEKDVDKAFDYVQRMLKKFQERMRELESGQGGGPGGRPGGGEGKGTPL